MNPVAPCLYFASHTIWMGHVMTTRQHTLLCAMSRNKKKMFLLYPLKWWVETLTGEIDVGGGVARCDTVALKEWSNLFWPSSVPYLNLLVNATCSLPKRKASVSSRSVESTHRICCSFISREKKKKEYTVNTYCSALLYEISLHYIQIYLMN